jgi:hypothetical protein
MAFHLNDVDKHGDPIGMIGSNEKVSHRVEWWRLSEGFFC